MHAKKKRPTSRKTMKKAAKAMKPAPPPPATIKYNQNEVAVILDALRYLPLNNAFELVLSMPDTMVRSAVANMPVARTDPRCVEVDRILRKTAPAPPPKKEKKK